MVWSYSHPQLLPRGKTLARKSGTGLYVYIVDYLSFLGLCGNGLWPGTCFAVLISQPSGSPPTATLKQIDGRGRMQMVPLPEYFVDQPSAPRGPLRGRLTGTFFGVLSGRLSCRVQFGCTSSPPFREHHSVQSANRLPPTDGWGRANRANFADPPS